MKICGECKKELNDEEVICQSCGAINVDGDFTGDSYRFWPVYEKYIDNHITTINGGDRKKREFVDPDAESEVLKSFHETIWSKHLPNGKEMELVKGKRNEPTLTGNKFTLASDTIFTSFIGYDDNDKCKDMFKQVLEKFKSEHNYRYYIEGYTGKFYRNIGSFIISPRTGVKENKTINQVRGSSPIYDRFDLTLECIHVYYKCQKNPSCKKKLFKNETFHDLYKRLFEVEDINGRKVNQDFLALFGDFKGYVDYFCLQDLVNDDYSHVRDLVHDGYPGRCWVDDKTFENQFPKNAKEYEQWMENQLDFVVKRTKRIKQAVKDQWEKQSEH